MAKFVLSDEAVVNSYGFRVATKGIDLKRFKSNPVMLSEHWNAINSVLGRWKNIKKEDNGQLTAEDEFDTEDEDAMKVSGKVERGFIKGVSIGITYNLDNMVAQPDGSFLLTKCELIEASICAIPSNANALKLYAETGELMDEKDVRLSLSSISTESIYNVKPQKENMKKVILTLGALMALDMQKMNTPEGVDLDAVNAGIEKLKAELDKATANVQTLKTANETLSAEIALHNKAKVESLIDKAITEGKLMATEKPSWVELATNNYDLAEKTLSAIPPKNSLGAMVSFSGKPADVKSIDDFVKLPLNDQLSFKANHPEEYNALFK